jgi:hypothetical protein
MTRTIVTCSMKQESNNGKGIIADHDRTEEEEIAQKQERTKNIRSLARQKHLQQNRNKLRKMGGAQV